MDIIGMSMNPTGLEDRLKDKVRVEEDRNASGLHADDEGMVSPGWVPVSGLTSVPCLIYEGVSQRSYTQETTEDLTLARILFAKKPLLPRDRKLRFVYYDEELGQDVYYYAHGKITFPAGAYQRVIARLGAIEE